MPTLDYSLNLTIEDDGSITLVFSDQGVSVAAAHASSHASGGADPITIANTQVTGLGTMSTQAASLVAITGGTIAGTTISSSTLSSPTVNTPTISGGTINGAIIGGSSPAAGTFTAVAGTTGTFSGAVSGTTGTFSSAVSGTTGTFSGVVTAFSLTLTTDLTVPNGGTGALSLTGILQGNGASAFSATTSSTVGQVLQCTGTNSFAFGALNLADGDAVTNTLPVANGGTGGATESAARTSLDVPAVNSTVRWRSDITALTGGASNALDSIDISNTTTYPTGACIAFSVSGELYVYRLTASGAGESSPDIIVPDTAYASREWTLITDSALLTVPDGGTGATTLTGILQGNGTSAFTATTSSTAGYVLRCTGTNTFVFGAVDLDDADAVTGTLALANGGTNASTAAGARTNLGFGSGHATLGAGGTVTITDASVSSTSIIVATHHTAAGPTGHLYVDNSTPGQFTVNSTSAADTNDVDYIIIY